MSLVRTGTSDAESCTLLLKQKCLSKIPTSGPRQKLKDSFPLEEADLIYNAGVSPDFEKIIARGRAKRAISSFESFRSE